MFFSTIAAIWLKKSFSMMRRSDIARTKVNEVLVKEARALSNSNLVFASPFAS
jgi:hypothetical protein